MTNSDGPGYKRPPKMTQFKPGQSGNPRGRPKGTRNLRTDLAETLSGRVVICKDGKQRRISRQEAMLLSLFNKAVQGDVKAATTVLNMTARLIPPVEAPHEENLSEADEQIIADFLRRHTPSDGDKS
jgi:hypothetical protein